MKRVAIIARGPSSAKYPGKQYGYDEVWTLNQLVHQFEDEIDRLFVMDDLKTRAPFYGNDGPEFVQWLVYEYKGVVITSNKYDSLPDNFYEYPLTEICADFGIRIGTACYSTPDYMIALAIHEGFTHIDLFGVDMSHPLAPELMRNATSLWIGVAQGRGVHVRAFQGSYYENFLHTGQTLEIGLYGYDRARPRIEHLVREAAQIREQDEQDWAEQMRTASVSFNADEIESLDTGT